MQFQFPQCLFDPKSYPHDAERIELRETHISWVILTGKFAYKVKKPVNFDFLDFSTLEKRRYFCNEEHRLNQRLAPQMYLAVVALTDQGDHVAIDGDGPPIEYAVKMRRFDDRGQFDRLLARGELETRHMESFAQILAEFHLNTAAVADAAAIYGEVEAVAAPVRENFAQIRHALRDVDDPGLATKTPALTEVESWSEQHLQLLRNAFDERKRGGYVRECHGDLHLQNIALIDDKPTMFDCIEFNAAFRWIDVMSEIAFFLSDCDARDNSLLGQQFLNRYLELTGDYSGLRVLNFYRVYRAMVRAKVAALRLRQLAKSDVKFGAAKQEYFRYLEQAKRYLQPTSSTMVITVGFSGSGKSTYAQSLARQLGWLRIRSDVERKRLFGLGAMARTHNASGQGLYGADITQHVYAHMARLTHEIINAGFSVIVDATFLTALQRQALFAVAQAQGCHWHILHFVAPLDACARRVRDRFAMANDPSEADEKVLMAQVGKFEPFSAAERLHVIEIDTSQPVDVAALCSRLLAIV